MTNTKDPPEGIRDLIEDLRFGYDPCPEWKTEELERMYELCLQAADKLEQYQTLLDHYETLAEKAIGELKK